MTEHYRQTAFLKVLMSLHEGSDSQALRERLASAERNERCLLIACWLVGGTTLAGLAGLSYSAVLLPQFFENTTPVLVRFFSALSLGSLLCLMGFLGLWLHYRTVGNRVQAECRRLVLQALQHRLGVAAPPLDPAAAQPQEELHVPHLRLEPPDRRSRGDAKDDLHRAA